MSTTDQEYQALVAQYGTGLSISDMRLLKYGGPTIPAKSVTDLEYTYWGPATDKSLNDKQMAVLQASAGGSGSISDLDKVVFGTRTNRVVNPKAGVNAIGYPAELWFGGSGAAGTQARVTGQTGPIAAITTCIRRTWTTGGGASGATGITVNETDTARYAAPPAGTQVTVSGWIRHSAANGSKRMVVMLAWGSTLTFGAAVSSVSSVVQTPNANVWTRFSVTGQVPVGAVSYWAQFGPASVGGGGSVWVTGETLDVTGVMFEWDASVGSYFDGDTPDTSSVDYAWTGTANASTSTATQKVA